MTTTMCFASSKTANVAPAADELTPPTFSSADASNETWYYIRFARQAPNNLVWSSDYSADGTWVIKQSAQKTADKETQQWKLVGTAESFYIVNRATGFNVAYAAGAEADAAKGLRGNDYFVAADGGPGALLKLVMSTDEGLENVTDEYKTDARWGIINPALSTTAGYMNDRAAGGGFAWRDICYYGWLDPGSVIEFVEAGGKPMIAIPAIDKMELEALAGETGTATYSGIAAFNLTEEITATIEGADAVNFGFAEGNALPEEGGALAITFSPNEAKVYHAVLILSSAGADPVSIDLTGNTFTASQLPAISSEDNADEHWYYIQFTRRSGDAKVWTAEGDTVAQSVLTPGSDAQQWKIYGNWNEYVFTSKTDLELSYDGATDSYSAVAASGGDYLGFVRFNGTSDWQVQNMDKPYINKDTGNDVPERKYINDAGGAGKYLAAYNLNDAGNRLSFIPVADTRLFAGPDSIGFGNAPIAYPVTRKYPIVKLNLTADANVSLTGDNAFSAAKTANGDSLLITFAPTEEKEYAAQVNIAAGQLAHAIKLTGAGLHLPFKVSAGDEEYWYQLQFIRQNENAFQDNGIGEKITQTALQTGDKDNQLWKITGTWDRYKIVAKSGNEFKHDADLSRYIAAAAGSGDLFAFRPNDAGEPQFYNMTLTSGSRYICDAENKGEEILNYSNNDGGNRLNFLLYFSNISASDIAFKEVMAGHTASRELKVFGTLLNAPISYSLTSDGDAFAVTAGDLTADGGILTITFSPSEARDYSASLTFSSEGVEDKVATLTGTADFTLPVTISTDDSEAWYYIQFARQAADNKVWTAGDYLAPVKQAAKEPTSYAQQWKVVGEWDAYGIVNRATGGILYFDDATVGEESPEQPLTLIEEEADVFAFKRANTDDEWQLQIVGKHNDEAEDEDYLNDYRGTDLCLYIADDGGNTLLFTPVDATGISVVDAGDRVVGVKYYTLLGKRIARPATTGVYIERSLHASGKVTAIKRLFVIQ
jgi:muconolactone delta-isomerase